MADGTEGTPAKKGPELRPVTMKDGRVVNFAGKRKMNKDVVIAEDRSGVSVRIDFDNGETGLYPVPAHLLLEAAGHGMSQKLGDYVAGLVDKDTKEPASSDDMYLEIGTLYDRLSPDGSTWNQAGEGGGGATGGSLVVQALMELKGKTREAIIDFINSIVKEEEAKGNKVTRQAVYQSFRGVASVKAIVDRLQAEKDAKNTSTPKVNADELLERMG